MCIRDRSELGRPMPISAMIETFVGEGLANYFETASAASGLVKSGHIAIETSEDNERCYHVTELGIGTAHTFEKNIPASVRDKAVSAARHYFVMKRRLSLIHISEPTRQAEISYAVFCLKKKKQIKS